MLKQLSTSLILRGVLAVIVGILALVWPGVTILALVILFAVYAFIDAGFQAMRAFTSGKAGPVIGHLLLGSQIVRGIEVHRTGRRITHSDSVLQKVA